MISVFWILIIRTPFSTWLRTTPIAIAFGVVLTKGEKTTNNVLIVDSKGKLLATYAKIHPFSFSGENNHYAGGNEICSCVYGEANIGLTICYDLRFPEIFQALSQSCNLILTIANWPERRVMHWTSLLQARAIENQSFMVGVNRTGKDGNGHEYVKSSVIFDPAGIEISPIHSNHEMDIYDISLTQVLSVRNAFPMKLDRKPDFYKTLL